MQNGEKCLNWKTSKTLNLCEKMLTFLQKRLKIIMCWFGRPHLEHVVDWGAPIWSCRQQEVPWSLYIQPRLE